MLKLKLFLCV